MASTYDFLGKATADGSAAVLTLSGIPGTYQDLEICCQVKVAASYGTLDARISLNGDAGTSHYSKVSLRIHGTSNSAGANEAGEGYIALDNGTGPATGSNMSGWAKIYIADYASTDDHSINCWTTAWDSTTSGCVSYTCGMYMPGSGAAITSITWTIASGVIESGCTIAAYGINYS